MAVQVEAVQVKDGTHPPTREQLQAAEEANPKLRPSEEGYKHALGETRLVTRYEWRSTVSGKTSNGCTFPNEESAKLAGQDHEKRYRG
jgi:hypothetical protein